ncbi:unnamed protein product [Bursaphelenchus xylophilus]|uniref:(pine wood nematode) hypothetical protein n=1 Tax=Bursaphelenchus xylophilus TaxID=6326 RepID=A0A1I7RIT7_BURXY|nr:unnamed protein product [Bursaphelenchus xylophilus]CAG9119084.1 unnamed protein product [Bursaphelenchus xylophilus]
MCASAGVGPPALVPGHLMATSHDEPNTPSSPNNQLIVVVAGRRRIHGAAPYQSRITWDHECFLRLSPLTLSFCLLCDDVRIGGVYSPELRLPPPPHSPSMEFSETVVVALRGMTDYPRGADVDTPFA